MSSGSPIVVAHVRIVSGAGGGPEKTILATPRMLEGSGYQAFALYLHAPGDAGFEVLRERARERGCELVAIEDRWPYDPRTLKKIAQVCRERGVRVWHGHDYKSNFYGVLLRKELGLRLVSTMHGWVQPSWKTPLYFAIDRWSLRRYEQVMAVSQDLFDAAREAGVAQERLTLIENAIDTEEFRRRAPTSGKPFVIGAVGRLSEEKGFGLLIEACERLAAKGREFELRIAGEGPQKDALAAQIAASKFGSRWKLLGFQKDTRALFEGFDLFALSSLREGLPNVVLEAMAMEVPVLATRCGGMEAFAKHGEDAFLVAPGSVDELERGLETLLEDSALRAKLAQTARARIERDSSFRSRIAKELAVYARLGLTLG
ncbi:MAG: glycosyltransferase family 4 protein [Planctomycetes bacterium]|nr:glycosyltransferase family 4 protein [Planctomycetota bacterium]